MTEEYEIEKKKIRENPYYYVTEEWAEKTLLHIGKRAFSILALMPGSLILPDIPFGSKSIPSTINNLLIAPSGTGKSSTSDKFEKITYSPLKRRDISARDLQTTAVTMNMLSLIIEDFTQFASGEDGYEKVKIAEGILGEEHSVNSSNMRTELLGEVRAIGLLMGTPTDLERYAKQLEGGLLSRCTLTLISLTSLQHNEIGAFINQNIGDIKNSETMNLKEKVVFNFYKDLYEIQQGIHEKFNPVVGYFIEKRFKEEIGKKWSALSEKLRRDLGDKSFIRDLNYYYKFLVSSAFLNIYTRKVEEKEIGRDEEGKIKMGCILHPNEQDHKLAMDLMVNNMRYKWAIEKAMIVNRRIKTFDALKLILEQGVPDPVRQILLNISPYGKFLKD